MFPHLARFSHEVQNRVSETLRGMSQDGSEWSFLVSDFLATVLNFEACQKLNFNYFDKVFTNFFTFANMLNNFLLLGCGKPTCSCSSVNFSSVGHKVTKQALHQTTFEIFIIRRTFTTFGSAKAVDAMKTGVIVTVALIVCPSIHNFFVTRILERALSCNLLTKMNNNRFQKWRLTAPIKANTINESEAIRIE